MLFMCGLASCGSTHSSTTSTPSSPSTPSTTIPITPSTPESPVNLMVDFSDLQSTQKPNIGADWSTDFTYTHDKAIVLKKTTDFIMTPPFKTTKGLNIDITGYLEKGNTADGKLVLYVEGLNKNKEVVETVEVKESEIKGTMEDPKQFIVNLKNSSKNIAQVKIGIKNVGRSTNFGINKLVVSSK